jgi:hypothetical protein
VEAGAGPHVPPHAASTVFETDLVCVPVPHDTVQAAQLPEVHWQFTGGSQVNVDGVRVPSLQSNDDTDGV